MNLRRGCYFDFILRRSLLSFSFSVRGLGLDDSRFIIKVIGRCFWSFGNFSCCFVGFLVIF